MFFRFISHLIPSVTCAAIPLISSCCWNWIRWNHMKLLFLYIKDNWISEFSCGLTQKLDLFWERRDKIDEQMKQYGKIAAVEKVLVVPQNIKYRITIWPHNSAPRCMPERTENRDANKYWYTDVHTSIVHKSQISVNQQMNGVISKCHRLLFSHKKDWSSDTCCNMDEHWNIMISKISL